VPQGPIAYILVAIQVMIPIQGSLIRITNQIQELFIRFFVEIFWSIATWPKEHSIRFDGDPEHDPDP